MGITTPHSLPYPEPSDPVADGATAIRELAEAVDLTMGGRSAEIHDTYAGKANGTPPAAADSGQTWLNAGVAWSIDAGRLVNVTATSSTAAYRDVELRSDVTRVGVRFVLPAGNTAASQVAYGVWNTSFAGSGPLPPDSPFHMSITRDGLSWGIWEAQAYTILAIRTFDVPLVADDLTRYETEAVIEGDTVTVRYPDGYVDVVRDSRIAALGGAFPFWEILATDGAASSGTRPEIEALWADANPVGLSVSTSPVGALYRAMKPAAPAWTTATLQNSWAPLGYGTGPAQYRKIGDTVQIRGNVTGGTIGTAIFTLPANCRPLASAHFPVASNDAYGGVEIRPDTGQVIAKIGSSAWFSLEGISWTIN